jgi:hypothetical protein
MRTALIPFTTIAEATGSPTLNRPRADFVAQLIATRMEAPQTRVRRRADPDDAVAAYGMSGRWLPPAGGALSRSV